MDQHESAGVQLQEGASSSGAAQPSKKPGHSPRRYVPLDVRTWNEASLVILGWLLVPSLAVLSGILFFSYEMLFINVQDRDLRDLYMDQRVMNNANNLNHKYFINGLMCCNTDPVVFNTTVYETQQGNCLPLWVADNYYTYWATINPPCPPMLQIQCPGGVTGTICNITRLVLYPLLGMDPVTGAYTECSRAGKVLVGAIGVPPGQPAQIVASYNGKVIDSARLNTPVNVTALLPWVDNIISNYSIPDYINPNYRLTKAFAVDGVRVELEAAEPLTNMGNKRRVNNWPTAIFDWPGAFKNGNRCPNTSIKEQWWLEGVAVMKIPSFNYNAPNTMVSRLTFLQDEMLFSPWKLESVSTGDYVGNLTSAVTVSILSHLEVSVSMVKDVGACLAWMIDESIWSVNLTYTPVYTGPMAALLTTTLPGGANTSIAVKIFDTAQPMIVELPSYSGMWYIVLCFGMGAVFAFSLGPFIVFGIPLIWWNVRSNRGLPPIVYRYMKKYRGW